MSKAANRRPLSATDKARKLLWVLFGFAFLFGLTFTFIYVVRLAWRLGGGG